jgi:Xaa-Pro aminopeptidase
MRRLPLPILLVVFVLAPTSLLCQAGSPAGPVPVERLQARRAALLDRIKSGIAVVRSAEERSIEGDYPQDSDYREDNDFFYLTGLEAPGGWLVLATRDTAPPEVILYLPARDTMQERWTGAKLGPGPEATALTGIGDVRSSAQAEADIRRMVGLARRRGSRLFLKLGERAASDSFLRELALGSGAGAVDLRPELAALRVVKDADEIRRLRRAIDISTEGHLAAMRAAKPGAWEYELEAAAEGTFRRLGAERLGYPSIVGAGFNGTTLHYDKSRSQLAADDLIVMDMGAEFGYYSADVTRTIPATGKFTSASGRSTTSSSRPSRPLSIPSGPGSRCRASARSPGSTCARTPEISVGPAPATATTSTGSGTGSGWTSTTSGTTRSRWRRAWC